MKKEIKAYAVVDKETGELPVYPIDSSPYIYFKERDAHKACLLDSDYKVLPVIIKIVTDTKK